MHIIQGFNLNKKTLPQNTCVFLIQPNLVILFKELAEY